MLLKDWIKFVFPFIDVVIFSQEEEEPIYEGNIFDIPWWIADCELDTSNEYNEPIEVLNGNNGAYIHINIIVK